MKTALIIHGHFYQPPRENPETGIVENQTSAKPYCNWNEAVYQTCYRPNANSRYLDSHGKIRWISNNYERMSSNFGPTLLNWMDSEHPRFVESLIEADRYSIKTLGHSNFIAQSYNHSILPLDRVEIKRIEIAWALADYKKRFGHDSEGFWCSECAIDKETIDELAKAGVKFVVLSPWQATAINGVSLEGKPAPCDRPFIIQGKTHSLSAFFYDPDLASGISFGHFLTDADKLYQILLDKKTQNDRLITCATDGEIYGHHEAFGDMALAALIRKIDDGNDFYLTNYASYLEKNPAKDVATLFDGKEHSGSSWSCCHGVERWVSDCGCHTGGPENWNQKWRTPFREALQHFEEIARSIETRMMLTILGMDADFDSIMVDYGKVVVNNITTSTFLAGLEAKYKKLLSPDEKTTIASLLNAYKYVMYSFTSCGWFFNDISGIEPKQNINYAVKAAKILQPYTKLYLKKILMNDLSNAKSNIPSEGTGADIAKKFFETVPGSVQACNFFIKNKNDKHIERIRYNYGFFNLRSSTNYEIVLENTVTTEAMKYTYNIVKDEKSTVIELKNTENHFSYSTRYSKDPNYDSIGQNTILDNISTSFAKDILENGISEAQINFMLKALDRLRSEGVEPNLTEIQNVIYPYLINKKKSVLREDLRTKLTEKLNFSSYLF